jgi:phosphate transport system ATP-binding protein
MSAHIDVTNLNVFYGKQQALNNVSIAIPRQKITVIMGPSGVAKPRCSRVLIASSS